MHRPTRRWSGVLQFGIPGLIETPGHARTAVHLFVLCSFAFAQPLFELLGRNPTYFTARGDSGWEIGVFAGALLLVPPAVLLAILLAIALVNARAARLARAVVAGGLVGVVALESLKKLAEDRTWSLLAVAVVVAIAAGVLYAYVRPAGTFLTVLAPAPFVFLGFFLLASPASSLVLSSGPRVQLADAPRGASVVVVVFDEFSSTSLMDPKMGIDAARFPNFAALAHDATWYRNATTVNPWTLNAVPALLSGMLPAIGRPAVFSTYPHSIYTLLGRTYAVNDHEALTQLCPDKLCARSGVSRVPDDAGTLISDTAVAFLHLLLPGDLAERLPTIGLRWGNFRAPASGGAFGIDPVSTFDRFLSSIGRQPQPTLSVIHLGIPHAPWQFLPSGRRYLRRSEPVPGLADHEVWGSDRWLVLQGFQRYLLQVGYADRLLGKLVRRLRETGLYDRALLVLAADHGVSFAPNDGRRQITPTSVRDIAFPPLFIKAPAQRRGRIVDTAMRTIDVVPTVASILRVPIPWPVDGRPARDRRLRLDERLDIGGLDYRFGDLLRARRLSLDRQLRLFGSGSWSKVYGVAPAYHGLLGRSIAGMALKTARDRTASLDDESKFRDVDPGGLRTPSYVTGSVRGSLARAGEIVAVAVNERIRALTVVYRSKGEARFGALVPEGAFRPGPNRVTVYVVSGNAKAPVLQLIGESGLGRP